MPICRPDHLSWLCNKVIELKPQSILDIGFGFGSNGMLFRAYTDVWRGDYFGWKTQIDGVEIYDRYITDIQRAIYSNIYTGNILDLVDELGYYDLIYMGDVLEHFEKEDGKILLEKLKKKARTLIIVTPRKVLAQGDVYGNEFETHRSQWEDKDFEGCFIGQFGNSMVIVHERPSIYYCDGMKFYGVRARTNFKFNSYNIQAKCLFLGLYFDRDYEVFKAHQGPRYVFWNGSDVSRLLGNPEWIDIVKQTSAVHACHNKELQEELASVGISAVVRPIFFSDIKKYEVCFYQQDKLQLYINAHPQRETEYGINKVLSVSDKVPDVTFHIYGVDGNTRENVVYHGLIDEIQMDREIKQYQGMLRLNKHDGLSQLLIKAGLMGQYIIGTQDLPGVMTVKGEDDILKMIKEIKKKKEPNLEFRDYYLDKLNNFDWL